jgi:hypothetical protein
LDCNDDRMFWKNRINRLLSYDASLDVVKLTGGWFANSAEPRFKLPTEARFVSPMYKETGREHFVVGIHKPVKLTGRGQKLTSAAELPVSLRLTSIDASRENNSPPIGEASVAMQIR